MKFDIATEAYLERLLDEAPAITDEQAALIVRVFARTPNDTSASSPTPIAA